MFKNVSFIRSEIGLNWKYLVKANKSHLFSHLLKLLIFLHIAAAFLPLNITTMLSQSSSLIFIGNPDLTYSTIQGRPCETCNTFWEKKQVVYNSIEEKRRDIFSRYRDEFFGEIKRIRDLVKEFNKAFLALYHEPCDGSWQPSLDALSTLYTIKNFAAVSPITWLVDKEERTEIYPTLFLMIARMLGALCIYCVVRKLSGSNLTALGSYLLLFYLTGYGGAPYSHNYLMIYTTIYFGQLLADHKTFSNIKNVYARILTEALVIALFALHSLLYLFTGLYDKYAEVCPLLIILIIILAALVKRHRILLIRAVFVSLALYCILLPYKNYSATIFGPISGTDDLTHERFMPLAIYVGFCERPHYYGEPVMDYIWAWPFYQDYYLYEHAQSLAGFQTHGYFGKSSLKEIVTKRPGIIFEAIWKRVFTFTFYHKTLFVSYNPSQDGFNIKPIRLWLWYFTLALGTVLFLSFLLLFFPFSWDACLPALAAPLWMYYGVSTVLFMYHAHWEYFIYGIYMMLCLFPGFLIFLIRERKRICPDWKVIGRKRALTTAVVVLSVIAFSLPYFVREIRKEINLFHIWHPFLTAFIPRSNPDEITPEKVSARFARMKALGHEAPGAVDMFAAWTFGQLSMYRYLKGGIRAKKAWPDSTIEKYQNKAQKLILRHYGNALREAPENPYFPAYAAQLQHPEWQKIFRRTLDKFPGHPFQSYLAGQLIPFLQGQDLERMVFLKEKAYDRFFLKTASCRPGYKRTPELKADALKREMMEDGGTKLILAPGEMIELNETWTYYSPKIKIGLYVLVLEGSVSGTLISPDGSLAKSDTLLLGAGDLYKYRVFSCENPEGREYVQVKITAGKEGGEFVIRDYYPLIEIIRMPRKGATLRPE